MPSPRPARRPANPKVGLRAGGEPSARRSAAGQLALPLRTWGGRRPGAGRPRKSDAGPSHRRRPRLASRHPVHVALAVEQDLPSLRTPAIYRLLEGCFVAGKERFGFRLVHFSVERHHLHLVAEARDAAALSRGVKGLGVRIARRLNAALGRRGRVLARRYFARPLRTPRETRAAVRYVLLNTRRHGAQRRQTWGRSWIDPCSSGMWFDGWRDLRPSPPPDKPPPVEPARTWLLRRGWRRHGLLALDEVPGP